MNVLLLKNMLVLFDTNIILDILENVSKSHILK